MITESVLEDMKQQQAQLQEALARQMQHLSASRMKKEDPNTTVITRPMKSDRFSIFYDPGPGNDLLLLEFGHLVNSELQLRGVTDLDSSLATRREQLRELLAKEYRLKRLTDEVDKSERPETALFLLLQAVPCILHLENRVGLKTLQTLVGSGFKMAIKKELHGHLAGENQRIKAYFSIVQKIINTSILGSETEPGQWEIPYDTGKKKLLPISFENWKTRRVMNQLDELVEVSITDETKKGLWMHMLGPYRNYMAKLRQKQNWNTEEEMAAFQRDIDIWIQDWIKIGGNVTNYMHLLASGHVSEYVGHYGNLYEHSQQGWEGLNALLKSVFFRRTSRGGGRKKSRLKPIARWLQRRMLWLLGLTKEKAAAYMASPTFEDALGNTQEGLDVEEEVYEGLFWEMVV